MKEMVAYCGFICSECPAYKATKKNDNKARAKIAEEWSKELKLSFKPEDINCEGCLAVGEKRMAYCEVCEVIKCCSDNHLLNCSYCGQYPCDKVKVLYAMVPQAKVKWNKAR